MKIKTYNSRRTHSVLKHLALKTFKIDNDTEIDQIPAT